MILDNYIEQIAKDENVNFLAFATTPWHSHGVVASLYYLKNQGFLPRGSILINPHPQTGYSINESFFPGLSNIEIKKLEKEPLSIAKKIKKLYFSLLYSYGINKRSQLKRILFVVEPWTINAALCEQIRRKISNVEIRHIVYDEGVSTYFPVVIENKNHTDWLSNYFTKYITFGLGYKQIQKNRIVISAKLFIQCRDKLVENSMIKPYYAKAISEFSNHLFSPICFDTKTIIICTTAWERKEIKNNEDIKVIKKVIDILKEKQYTILIKQHPRDKYFKVNYGSYQSIDNPNLSLESILFSAKNLPAAIMSISSTILVTCKYFFNLPTYDLSQLLDTTKIGKYIYETSAFNKAFGEYVNTIESIEEVVNKIETR